MINPFGSLLQGLQAVNAIAEIGERKDARALNQLRALAALTEMEQAKKRAEVEQAAIAELFNVFGSGEFERNPASQFGRIASALAMLGKASDINDVGNMLTNLTKFNMFNHLSNALNAFDSKDMHGLVDHLVRFQQTATNMPWQGIVESVGKDDVKLKFVSVGPDGNKIEKRMVVNYDTLYRMATAAAENPNAFSTGIATVHKLKPDIELTLSQAAERRAQAVQNLASAEKLRAETNELNVLLPLKVKEKEALAQIQSIRAVEGNLQADLAVANAAMKLQNEFVKSLTENYPDLPTEIKSKVANFYNVMVRLQLSGLNISASDEAFTLFHNLLNKNADQAFEGYQLEAGVVLTPEQRAEFAKLPPNKKSDYLKQLVASNRAQLIYLYSSPNTTRIPLSQSLAGTLRSILGTQFKFDRAYVPVIVNQNNELVPFEELMSHPDDTPESNRYNPPR